jgi:tRNA uridine 5-carboxymethylaminomethyl modification enzyme
MFTSRAEYRLLLRQDNADLRLTPKAYELGLVSDERMARVEKKASGSASINTALCTTSISPEEINPTLEKVNSALIKQKVKLDRILSRPQVGISDLAPFIGTQINAIEESLQKEVVDQVEVLVKYGGYINKEKELAERLSNVDHIPLKGDLDYSKLGALSNEAREKLQEVRPTNLGQAGRISGVSPADISYLMVYLGR